MKDPVNERIEREISEHDVVLFMKGTPQFPQCGFSGQVVQILDHVGVGYKGLNVLESADLRDGIKTYSNWPTIPQLYVKGEFVGGCDIIREMFQAGELQQLLADKGVTVSTSPGEGLEGAHDLLVSYRAGDVLAPQLGVAEALATVAQHFAECVREGRRPLTDGVAGLRVIRVLEAAERSLHDSGIAVPLG